MPGSLSNPLCLDHDSKECVCWCQTCSKAECLDCVTSSHIGHRFVKLETVLQEKRASLQKELESLESTDLKKWKHLTTEARKATTDFLEQVNGIEKELEDEAETFHRKVDEILENKKTQLKELTASSIAVLHEQEKRVSDGLEKVKQEIKECEDRLRSDDIQSLLEHKGAHDKKNILPKISSEVPPVFTSGQIDTNSLIEMFGKLTIPIAEIIKRQYIQSATDKFIISQSYAVPDIFLLQPTSELKLYTWAPLIACAESGHVWVQAGIRKLELMDRHNSVTDTIEIDFTFEDVVISQQRDLLLSDSDNNCIKSITQDKKVKKLFKTRIGLFRSKLTPCGLCCLHSGDIAVTFADEGRVIIYSMSGEVIKELDKKLFTYPHRVTQSKINSDLYISDAGARKVVALDKDYRVRYEYTGQGERGSFHARGLCTDNAGHVLITDWNNNRVHILDKDGKFLQYLLTEVQGLERPSRIDVDNEGNAWVGDLPGVTVVKYLQ